MRVVDMKPLPPRSGHARRHKPVENKGITRTVKLVAAGLFCSLLSSVYKEASSPIVVKDTLPLIAVPTVDFHTLHHSKQEFGPQLTSTLECLLHNPYKAEEAQTNVQRKGTMHITKDPIARYALQHGIAHAGLESYLKHVKGLIPRHSAPLRVFPENLSAFFLNEYAFVGHGESACKLTEPKLVDTDECNYLIEVSNQYLEHHPEQKAQVAAQAETSVIGTVFSILSTSQETKTMRLGIDPTLHANYYRAIKKLEADWLQDPCFFGRPKEDIEASLLEIYKLFVGNDRAGYREQQFVRMRPGMTLESADLDALNKVDYTSTPGTSLLEKKTHIPTKIDRIPQEMMEFIAKLKEYAASDVHPAALAAWVFGQLERIVPFDKYSDEFGWLFVNAILQMGGFESVYHPDDKAFAIAISKELDSPGCFTGYLASLIKTQSKGPQLFSYKL